MCMFGVCDSFAITPESQVVLPLERPRGSTWWVPLATLRDKVRTARMLRQVEVDLQRTAQVKQRHKEHCDLKPRATAPIALTHFLKSCCGA
jgi:hypothetical protein